MRETGVTNRRHPDKDRGMTLMGGRRHNSYNQPKRGRRVSEDQRIDGKIYVENSESGNKIRGSQSLGSGIRR